MLFPFNYGVQSVLYPSQVLINTIYDIRKKALICVSRVVSGERRADTHVVNQLIINTWTRLHGNRKHCKGCATVKSNFVNNNLNIVDSDSN